MIKATPIRVVRVEVLRGHLVCTIQLDTAIPRTTSPQLIASILPACPNLARHACVNECGNTFAAVIDHTPMPHLLEHMIVELQVREMAGQASANQAPTDVSAANASGSRVPTDTSAANASANQALADASIVGTSEWLDEAAGLARIDVSFTNDHIALRALRDAVATLNSQLAC